MLWLLQYTKASYHIAKIDKSPGIYYEEISHVKFKENSWDLVSYLDLQIFEDKLKFLENSYNQIKALCEHETLTKLLMCKTYIKTINQLLDSMYSKEQTLKTLIGHKRVKRAWLNIIGTISKTVFGTMDQEDADYYNSAINNVTTNEKHLLNLFKQQIHVVQSTITNFNNTISRLNDNRIVFNENFKKLESFTSRLNENQFNLELKQTLEEQFSLITLMLNELEIEYTTVINSILFAKSNSLHPFIMTPNQLVQELIKTLPFLTSTTTYILPLNEENAYKLVEHVTIKCHFHKNRIIYVISNPLVTNKLFTLYNLIPLPVMKESDTFIIILPTIKYLAVSEDKNTYSTINTLRSCEVVNQNITICANQPVYHTHARPICETELLFSNKGFSKMCESRILKTEVEIWHKLEASNSWLFVLPKITDVTISCPQLTPSTIILDKTGIITIDNNCKLFTSSTTVISGNPNFETSLRAIIPDFTINLETCCESENKKRNESKLNIIPLQVVDLDKDSLKIANQKLSTLDESADNLLLHSRYSKFYHNSYFTFVICSILKLLGLYLIYRLYKYCTNRCPRNKTDSCCQNITNCLTLNICKKTKTTDLSIELEDQAPCSSSALSEPNSCETTPIRRSVRLAKLKDKI